MNKNEESRALTLVKWISNKAIDGVPPLSSAHDLADEYLIDRGYKNHDSRIDALINWETAKNFTSGFVTGLGGLLVLPFALPTAFAASWIIQARMAAAIARIYGHNIHSDRVRTFIMAALVGDSLKDIAKASGIVIGRGLAKSLIEKVPGKALIEVNKRVGFRLLTKAGEKGAINLMKGVPFVGGVVGGTFDAVACRVVGRNARALFVRRAERRAKKRSGARPRATRTSVRRQRRTPKAFTG
jgi:EcsC protein family